MGYLRAVGIDAGLRFMATAARVTALRANRSAASYGGIASTTGDASATVSRFFRFSADDTNRDAEVRDLLARADTSMDPAVRTEAYSAALALITERAYMVPLYIAPTYYVAGSELAFDPSADGNWLLIIRAELPNKIFLFAFTTDGLREKKQFPRRFAQAMQCGLKKEDALKALTITHPNSSDATICTGIH